MIDPALPPSLDATDGADDARDAADVGTQVDGPGPSPGPRCPATLTGDVLGYPESGLQIRAVRDMTLTTFRFNNQGHADRVRLTDEAGTTLGMTGVPAGRHAYDATVHWDLVAGRTYHLVSDDPDNGRFVRYTALPTPGTQMVVEGTYADGYLDRAYWFSFTNLPTCDP